MKIVDTWNKIKRKISGNNLEELTEGVVTTYKEKKEDDIVEEIMKIIKDNPDYNTVKALIKELLEREEIPDGVVRRTTAKLLKTDEIPDVSQAIVEAVQETEVKVPSEVINTIIEKGKEEGTIGVKQRIDLIQNVEDRVIIEKHMKDELKILYNNCINKRDVEIADRVKEITGLLENSDISMEMQGLIYKVVAKKMAENCYSRNFIRIYDLSQIMPVEEMMEKDLPSMVLNEYKKIEQEEGRKDEKGFYNKKDFEANIRKQILNQMAGDIAQKYQETGVFLIPQSGNMKKLETEEENEFIKTIQILSRNELLEEQISTILEEYPKIDIIKESEKTKSEDKKTLEASIRNYILNQIMTKKQQEKKRFIMPKLDKIEDLTPEEEKKFIEKVQALSKNKELENQIINIKAQIKGIDILQTKENMLISKIKALSNNNKNASMDFLIQLLGDIESNSEIPKTLLMLDKFGVIKQLSAMPDEKRQESIEVIGKTLEKRKTEKIATETLKMEGEPQIDIYLREEGR